MDEQDYEDFDDYIEAATLKGKGFGLKFVKFNKPFTFVFEVNGEANAAIKVNSREVTVKYTKL